MVVAQNEKKSMKKFIMSLPPWGRAVIAIMAIVTIVIVFIWLKNLIALKKSEKNSRAEVNANETRLDQLGQQGVLPTISRPDFESMANAMQAAADGCDPWGQGAQVIMQRIYALQNEADYRSLVDAFGIRTWDQCGYGTGDVTGSLTTLMISELNSSQLAEARRHLGQFGVTF